MKLVSISSLRAG